MSRSARGDLPWSIWATIAKLRMFEIGGVIMRRGIAGWAGEGNGQVAGFAHGGHRGLCGSAAGLFAHGARESAARALSGGFMAHINYQALRGKVHAFAPAVPSSNPHLWVILEAGGRRWFATINVRSNKDAPGEPVGKSYLYYLVDTEFAHPIVPTILARPEGLSPVDRSYDGGALDFQRGNLFNPN